MPKHVRSIECCYCGASSLVNLKEANRDALKCGECGARMAAQKMKSLREIPDAAGWNGERPARLAPQWQGDTSQRGPKPEEHKPKKKKGLFDMVEDIWDEVEDIFD